MSVSIITYNQRDYIGQAIDSALAQETDFPVEVRVGDDFSTDGTREVLLAYRERYPERVRLNLQPERPSGVPGRVNNATNLSSCVGEYIAMLDGDDYWVDRRKLQKQVDFLDANPGHAGSVHDSLVLEEGQGPPVDTIAQLHTLGPPAGDTDFSTDEVFMRLIFQTSSFVFRRRLLPAPLPDWFMRIHSADVALYLIAAKDGPLRYMVEPMSVYRRHAAAWMRTVPQLDFWERAMVERRVFREELGAVPPAPARASIEILRARLHFRERHLWQTVLRAGAVMAHHPPTFARWVGGIVRRRTNRGVRWPTA
ncbi:glycosyltransferase [Acuticoccus sp.]|uniref:glycosyltransferase n=1 Tax=Acuticoccus sp. TaxID=1904378 RepID=UPI003B5246C8